MASQNHAPPNSIPTKRDRAQIASTYQIPPPQTPPPSGKKQVRAPGDLTSRLVSIFLWLSFGTTAGCIGQMAVTRRPPNIGAGMAVGLTAALTCAYKDLESGQVPRQLLTHPQKFFNRFEARLDEHSVQLAENTGGQERLETKLNLLSDRVDTLTLAMIRPIAKSESVPLEPPPVPVTSDAHVNGNGQPQTSLGAGF
ncbi:MAG: hypothetical protein DCF15_21710 [Phormidesmis priestleyi]|uniref:Uncharacterized protein n=1 Tax=Phormidesmis priestleyi TaxID=268141 RepID=A0A2W4WL76_9CYAN|nr:MAG: hypothetical protein DCF15_21710 [Phormidesmis priestleyi]